MQFVLGLISNANVVQLLQQHSHDMYATSPADSVHTLDIQALSQPDIRFWTLWDGDHLAGCGALKRLDKYHGEIKSMRTHPDFLRMGIAGKVLEHIITVAQSRSYKRLCLETGSGEAFDAALGLYRKRAFIPCDAFGEYEKSEFNQFFALDLQKH